MFNRKQVLLAISGLLLLLTGLGLAYMHFTYNPESPLIPQPQPKTTKTGDITESALSPDGQYMVYGREEGMGRQSLWLVKPKNTVDLDNAQKIEFRDEAVSYNSLAFSHDSNYFYYVKYREGEITGKLLRLRIQEIEKGKVPEEEIKNGIPRFFTFSVSPVDERVAYVWREGIKDKRLQFSVKVLEIKSREEKSLLTADNIVPIPPAWRPDGQNLIYAASSAAPPGIALFEMPAYEGRANNEELGKHPIILTSEFIGSMAWLSDSSSLLVTTSERVHGPFQLMYISYPDGKRRELLQNVPQNSVGISLNADSTELVTVSDIIENRIWYAEKGKENNAKKVVIKGEPIPGGPNDFYGFAWLSDKEIVYGQLNGRKQNLFLKNIENDDTPINLTNDVGDNYDPSVTPDKSFIVFASTRTGKNRIWKMDRYGRNQTLISDNNNDEQHTLPFCHGDWVYYVSSQGPERFTLRRVKIDGTSDELVRTESVSVKENLLWPAVSKDNKIVAFYNDGEKISLKVFGPEGKDLVTLSLPPSANTWAELRWVDSGEDYGIIFINTEKVENKFVSNLRLKPLRGGEGQNFTHFDSDRIFRYEITPDAQRLILSKGNIIRNAQLIHIERQTRLADFVRHPVISWLYEHSRWIGIALGILLILYILYFTPLPLDALADLYPPLNSVATLLYVIRGGDWRIFRIYRENLRARLLKDNTESFYKPLPVELEGEGRIQGRSIVERILDLVKAEPVLITGPGGAGKSTLLRQLALGCLESNRLMNRLPIYLDPDTDAVRTLKDQLITYMKNSNSYVNQTILDAQLRKGSFFFIIDGVSELTDGETQKLLDEMHTLVPLTEENAQQNLIVLAGRYYEGIKFKLHPGGNERVPRRVELPEVDLEDLKSFCREYLTVIRNKDSGAITEEAVSSLAEHIMGLPRIPLIIRLAIEDYERKGQAPKSTLELFKNSLDLIMPKNNKLRIHAPALFELLHHLAWEKFIENEQREVNEEQLIELISKIEEKSDLFQKYQGEKLSQMEILDGLLRSGIMIRQLRRIRFWHDSFEDYLCAYHFQRQWAANRRDAKRYLRKMKTERIFSEVIMFLSRMVREEPDPDLIFAINEPPAQEEPTEGVKFPIG
jgi:Tol biopolymer transport system component/energy-coupling factor transporter ATP-binding protein EcfA2